jgi:hypothetical protein
VTADHRGAFEHRAILGTEPLDARCEQCMNGGRHFEPGKLGADDPAIAFLPQCALVDEHAHQLADE